MAIQSLHYQEDLATAGKKPILLVDDDADIRLGLTLALQEEGYKVYTANNGEEGLEFLLKHPLGQSIGLVILDLMMPKMDGIQFLKMINTEYQELKQIPIIVCSAQGKGAKPEDIALAKEMLPKPVNLDRLYELVGKYCSYREEV